jgi:hypothetical protein
MDQLSIEILQFLFREKEAGSKVDSDNVCENFQSFSKTAILESIASLCGVKAGSGYILWHLNHRSPTPAYDLLDILPKGQKVLDDMNN